MLRQIAICDDEKSMLRQLSLYLNQMQEETGDQYDVYLYGSAEDLLAHMPRQVRVIMLDISMGGITGMECAKRLRAEGVDAEIFFITSLLEYAIEGYGVHAFTFLEKPVTYEEFRRSLLECFEKIDGEHQKVLPMTSSAGTELLQVQEIMYAEVYHHETSFTLKNGRKVSGTMQLTEVEKRLDNHGFFRCHRSYLVNLQSIRKITPTMLTMENGEEVPVSKYRYKELQMAYASFMGVQLG